MCLQERVAEAQRSARMVNILIAFIFCVKYTDTCLISRNQNFRDSLVNISYISLEVIKDATFVPLKGSYFI